MKSMFLVYLFIAVNILAASESNKDIMPPGFEQVQIGMDWRSMVKLRPNAEVFMRRVNEERKPDPDKPRALTEELVSGPLSPGRAFYSFEGGTLAAVMFVREEGRYSANTSNELITRVSRGGRMPDRIGMTGRHRDHAALTWQDENLHVNVMMPTDASKPNEKMICLQILDRRYAERIKVIGVTDNSTKIDQKTQNADKERIAAIRNEVEKILKGSSSSK